MSNRRTMEEDIKLMKEEAGKLLKLLENPQPGLISWRGLVGDRLNRLNNIRIGEKLDNDRG